MRKYLIRCVDRPIFFSRTEGQKKDVRSHHHCIRRRDQHALGGPGRMHPAGHSRPDSIMEAKPGSPPHAGARRGLLGRVPMRMVCLRPLHGPSLNATCVDTQTDGIIVNRAFFLVSDAFDKKPKQNERVAYWYFRLIMSVSTKACPWCSRTCPSPTGHLLGMGHYLHRDWVAESSIRHHCIQYRRQHKKHFVVKTFYLPMLILNLHLLIF